MGARIRAHPVVGSSVPLMQFRVVHDARVIARPTRGPSVPTVRVGTIPAARCDRSVSSGVPASCAFRTAFFRTAFSGSCLEVGQVAKHVFVTGGVASSLGKGLTASSLGRLLKSRGSAGHDAEARPVHQRRPRHDEPVPARGGVRHRRQGRDRPRPRPLRALRRRRAHAQVERDHGFDLPVGARQGAPRRVPR